MFSQGTCELGPIKELMSFNIFSKEDVIGLGLERGTELVLIQLLSLEQNMTKRLDTIEMHLCGLEKGKGRAGVEEDDYEGKSNGGSEMFGDWLGCAS